MKKELKKHRNSNIVDTNLRDMTRHVFRKQEIDAVMPNADGNGATLIEGLKVSPDFAAIVERISKIRAGKTGSKEYLQKMADVTEVYTPPTEKPSEEAKKKQSAFQETDEHETASTIVKKQSKSKKTIEIKFIPDKKLGIEVIFKSDMQDE